MSLEICRVYENPALRKAGDGLVRPGGLELTRKAVAISGLRPGSLVLDIGCGTGAALRYLAESCACRAVGIDLSNILLEEGKEEKPELSLTRASAEALPFADSTMDAILAECSLSLMENVGKVLNECSRVLKPEGLLLVHDVYARNPHGETGLRALPVKCCLTGAISREEWIERLDGHAFAVLFWEDHSRALNEFAARLIFSYGSLENFWSCSREGTPELEQGRKIQNAISSAKPGYFLAVAKKRG